MTTLNEVIGQSIKKQEIATARENIKRSQVKAARKALYQARHIYSNSADSTKQEHYYIVRHTTFRHAVVALWGMGYHTGLIADYIGNGVTERLVLQTMRHHLGKYQKSVLESLMSFDKHVTTAD